jgi:hypothetical protein
MTRIGRNRNLNNVVRHDSYTLNDSTATEIAVLNMDRLNLEVFLAPGVNDIDVILRLYDALDDNNKVGPVLTRRLLGNDVLFNFFWRIPPDNIYVGPVSAISMIGPVTIYVIEY